MPAAWSQRDERQYGHILKSCRRTDRRRSMKTCKRIAATTVNKQRGREGRTLSGLVPALYGEAHRRRVAALRRAGCKVTLVQRPEGTLVLKRCPPGAKLPSLDGCGCDY